ncbi:MAG TPA: transglutaminase domain-containing protein [Urbifossiella sp.]|nr:transglutaminase domain-containing protein [Urbifossiella sp.]
MNRCLLALAFIFAPAVASAADFLHGDWFIIHGNDALAASYPGGDVARALGKHKSLGSLAFNCHGNWAFLFANNGIIYSNIAPALSAKIPDLWKARRSFRGLAFRPQGGWILLLDKNEFVHDGLPKELVEHLEKAQKANRAIRSIAFAPTGGWAILFDQGFFEQGLPKALTDQLAGRAKNRIGVRCLSFTSQGDWFLIDDKNGIAASNPNHAAYKRLTELRTKGETLHWVAVSPGEYTHGYVLEHSPVQRIKAVMSMKLSRQGGGVSEWVVLPPQAPELPRQRDIKRTFEPDPITVQDFGPHRIPVVMERIRNHPLGVTSTATYEMTLYTNRLVPRRANQPPGKIHLAPETHALFTQSATDMKTKLFLEFLRRSQLHRMPNETDMALARRAFLYISTHFTYLYPNPTVDVIEVGKGDCGGLSWLFARVLRANGIPARLLYGRWAVSEAPEKGKLELNGQYHVKPEFFIDGLGWVGADMSGGVGVFDSGEDPFICFGTESGDFVVTDLDVERSLKILPKDRPTNIDGLQLMAWWWYTDKAGQDPKVEHHWKVEVLSKHPIATPARPWKRPPPSGPHRPIKQRATAKK